jgi:hypothetical protein
MDWSMVMWGMLLGMVGVLWVMAIAVMQDKNGESHSKTSTRRAGEGPSIGAEKHHEAA